MSGWLLDTNVLSELRKPIPDKNVVAFVAAQPLEDLYISDVVLAEIRSGIEQADDARKRAELHEWLENVIRPMFAHRALAVSEDVIVRWCLLVAEGRREGVTHSQPDLFIAATALLHGLTVVTRNTADYAKSGVPLLDPWKPRRER